ncbi:MAG: hypothetical protein WC928_03880 [Patescibacteria group bacterium]|jgi:hypothetical protein
MLNKKTVININNNPNKSFVQASFIDPHKNQLEKAGLLFFLIEINQPDRISEKIAYIIGQLLEKNYYLNEKIFLTDYLNGLKVEAVFESALIKTNQELLEFIDQEKINFNFKTLNIIAGLIYNEQVYFSSIGQNKSFLLRKTDKGLQISDINPENEDYEIEELASGKIFSSIISGDLPLKSHLIFSNDSLAQYLNNEDLLRVIEELKIEGATEQIKNHLKEINNYSNFCALIIKNCPSNTMENCVYNYSEPDLNKTEKTTEKLLTIPGSINKEKINKKIRKTGDKIGMIIERIIKKLKKLIQIKKRDDQNNDTIPLPTKKNKTKKILIIALGLLFLILIINFCLKKNNDTNIVTEESASNYEELLRQKQSQIESSLLYNNETRAKEILEETKKIISNLSDKEKNKIKDYNEIEKKLEEYSNVIQKIIKITNPQETANLSLINSEAQVSAMAINSDKNKIYAVDGKNNSIYFVNLENGLLGKLTQDLNIIGEKLLSTNGDKSYFLTANNLVSISNKDEVVFKKINIENINAISAIDIYNDKPYLLDKDKNNIYRYTDNGSEFSSPSARLENTSNEAFVSMEIDHSVPVSPIYLLGSNGSIFKYFDGKKQEFSVDIIEPQLENPNIIKVGSKYLFVLDKTGQRFVIYLKESGLFINQYYSDKFDNAQDIIIDEKNLKVYILNNNYIYKIDIIL